MTLEQAIQHLKDSLSDPNHDWGCDGCKNEHSQLLMWLEELLYTRAFLDRLAEIQRSDIFKLIQHHWLSENGFTPQKQQSKDLVSKND